MRLAIGVTVHTGWAAYLLVGGSLHEPSVVARETVEMLGDPERFVFHRAADMTPVEARAWVARATADAQARAAEGIGRLRTKGDVVACAVVAKAGAMPELNVVLASHPRIHAAEGLFYRDVVLRAAEVCGLRACLVPPAKLDPKSPRLARAGDRAGKPWDKDWKLAALAAWGALET